MKPFPKSPVAALRRLFMSIFLRFLLLAFTPQGRAVDYWVAPTGNSSVTTNSIDYPMAYTTANVRTIIASNPKSSGQSNVTIFFKWGTYEIDQLTLPASTPPTRQLCFRAQNPAVPPVFRYKVPTGTNLFNGRRIRPGCFSWEVKLWPVSKPRI